MAKFIKVVENNDHEGETWIRFINYDPEVYNAFVKAIEEIDTDEDENEYFDGYVLVISAEQETIEEIGSLCQELQGYMRAVDYVPKVQIQKIVPANMYKMSWI